MQVGQSNRIKSILIIDDEEEILELEELYIARHGARVIRAENGLEGLNKCSRQKFDAIICDISMPVMKGDSAIDYIKKSNYNKDTPIFVLSGYISQEVVDSIKGKIVKAFVKPTDLELFVKYIFDYINK